MPMRVSLLARIGALLLAVHAGPAGASDHQPVGERFEVRAGDLPAPRASASASNPAQRIPRPEGATLKVPPGFRVNIFAEGFRHARYLLAAPGGDVFLAEPNAGRISILRDADGDGRAETIRVFAEGLDLPHGLALREGWLYVAEVDQVRRMAYRAGDLAPAGAAEPVTPRGVLGRGGHYTRNIVFAPDGRSFFVSVGSRGNTGEEAPPRATIQRFDAAGSNQMTFATGLRNPIGIAFRPGSDELWTVVNERDGLGDGLVPDFLARVVENGFYGWPYAYAGRSPDPDFGHRRPDLVASAIVPDLMFRAHSAPIDLVFYDGARFPAEYRGDAFVTLQGSWNSAQPVGYMVARVPFADGRPRGWYETFASGFWHEGTSTARIWGRPAGIVVARDGSLLVADDASNTVWRISYGR